jgi:MFS family permease
MTLIPNTLVPQWFKKKRAFALSIAGLGGLVAMLLVPSFNLWMISQIGWQNAWRIWSLILIIGFIPIVFVFAANKPEDLDMTIENDMDTTEQSIAEALIELDKDSFSLSEAIKVKEFWIVGMINMIPAMFSTGLAFHFFTIMELRSISSEAAAVILGLMALPAFIMPFISKLVVDKYPVKYILSTTLFMTILSMVFLMFGVNNVTLAIIFILFYGLGIAVQTLSTNVLWPNYFGRKHLGSIQGAAIVFMVVGSALGPLPFGIAYDITGGYNIAILGMIIFTSIAFFLSFLVTKPTKV